VVSTRQPGRRSAVRPPSVAPAQATIQTLQTSLQAATAQIATLTADKAQLSAALAQSATINQALSGQVAGMNATLAAIAAVLGKDNGNAAFTLPGATPEAQLAALRQAIDTLNHGQKQALYKALGGK
jgi:Tfp pilus assembly protein PilN